MNVVGRIELSGKIDTKYLNELVNFTGGHVTVEDGKVIVTIGITRF